MKKYALVSGVLFAMAASPALANWGVNVGPIQVAPNESSSNLDVIESVAGLPAGSTQLGVNNNTQLGLTLDYRAGTNWGLQLIAATPFEHDIKVKGSAIDGLNVGSTKHLPPTLLAQYFFNLGSDRIEPFVGVGLNYTTFFNEKVAADLSEALIALNVATPDDAIDLKLKDSFGLALQAGVKVRLTERLGLHAMVSKMDIGTTGRVRINGVTVQRVDVDIDPVVAMVGLRYQF
ncbi:OmpW/AlkL family protein [Aliidiomarina sp. Khilg15.8]